MNRSPSTITATRSTSAASAPVPTPAEWAVTWILALACVIAPLAFGATGEWSRFGVEAVMALGIVAWALSRPGRGWACLTPLAIAAVVSIQLIPLGDGALQSLSPVAASAWKISLAGAGGGWGRITVDPTATAAAIRRLFLATATIGVVADLARRAPLRTTLCGGLCVVCVAIWVLGIALPFDRKNVVMMGFIDFKGPIENEFWKTPVESPMATNGSGNLETIRVGGRQYRSPTWIAADGFGPYIYSNHFAGAMVLTLPIVLGAMLAACHGRAPPIVAATLVGAIVAAAAWTVGISATSRAGVLSLGFAACVFATLSCGRTWLMRTAMAVTAAYGVGVLAIAFVLYGGVDGIERLFPDAWEPRVAAMLADGRAIAARAALRMFAAAPLIGSGLGTFGELFPRFLDGDLVLHYAHNDYAQWIAETGLMGLAIGCAGVAALGRRFLGWWHPAAPSPARDPLIAGAWAATAGIAVHTAFDWNLHVPANALLACVVIGIAAASGAREPDTAAPAAGRLTLGGRVPGIVLAVSALIAVAGLGGDAAADRVEKQLRAAIVASRLDAISPNAQTAGPKLLAAIESGQQAANSEPRNGNLAVLIGLAHLHLAAQPAPYGDPTVHSPRADMWFMRARRNCATCIGLPDDVR